MILMTCTLYLVSCTIVFIDEYSCFNIMYGVFVDMYDSC